jgi:hypothetical protein
LFQGSRGFHTEKAVSTPRLSHCSRRAKPRASALPKIAAAVLACSLVAGCSAAAAVHTVKAAAAVETARSSGAAKFAPYELAAAEAYLAKAREEASQAQYVDAIRFAKSARQNAEKAVEKRREAPQ